MDFQNYLAEKIQDIAEPFLYDVVGVNCVECGEIPLVSMQEAFIACMEWWCENIDKELDKCEKYSDTYGKLMDSRGVSFVEWKELLDSTIIEEDFKYYRAFEFFCVLDNIQRSQQFLRRYEATYEHYLEALQTIENDAIRFFLHFRLRVRIPFSIFRENVHITAGAGGGKSEIIKLLFYHLQRMSQSKRQFALVCIEPSGKLAKELLFFNLNRDYTRIEYINPHIHKMLGIEQRYIPTINPFELKTKDPDSISLLSQKLASAFVQIIGEEELTRNMKNIFNFCMQVLLENKEVVSIQDLYEFVSADEEHEFVQWGREHHRPIIVRFFTHDFFKDRGYKSTKDSIRSRMITMLQDEVFEAMVSGKSTIDLEKCMNDGKVVIVDVAKGVSGEDTARAFGKLVLAKLEYIAAKRAVNTETKPKQMIVFVDEAQNYINESTDTTLSELRKYGLTLVLVHQYLKQLDPKIRDSIGGNTRLKMIGSNSFDTKEPLARQAGIDPKYLAGVEKNAFCIKDIQSSNDPFILRNPMTLAKTQDKAFFMAYDQKKDEKGRKIKTLSDEQRTLLLWMINRTDSYQKYTIGQGKEQLKNTKPPEDKNAKKNTERNKGHDDTFTTKHTGF